MSVENERRGVHVSAGDGIVAHVKTLTAFANGDDDRLNELLVRLNALAEAPWQEIVRTITAGIAEADYDDHPDIACVSVEDDRVAALVFGDTSLSITIDGTETTLDGRDSSTWIDVALRGEVDRIHAGTQSDSALVGVLRDGVVPAGGFLLDTSGPMPASGRWAEMTANAEAASAAEAAVDATAATQGEIVESVAVESVVGETVETIEVPVAKTPTEPLENAVDSANQNVLTDAAEEATSRSMFARIEELGRTSDDHADVVHAAETDEGAEASAPPRLFGSSSAFNPPNRTEALAESLTPTNGLAAASASDVHEVGQTLAPARHQLRGVLCMSGHLTAPKETSCRTCGQPVPNDAKILHGDRPVLGTITFDDGAVLPIDRPAVIGSNVPTAYVVGDEPATIVRLDDGMDGISAIQVEVRLSGWDVEIVDMQSENGTYTMIRGERQTRTRLRAGQSVVLQPGMTVETGGRSFIYTVGPTPLPE